jgi:hypothetical protein
MSIMAPVSIVTGILLTALGVWAYLTAEHQSPTALIPAALGVPLILLGLLGLRDRFRKHAMHAAVLIGLVGLVGGGVMGFPHLGDLFAGTMKKSHLVQNLMALISGVFVLLGVRSFVAARIAQRKKNAEAPPS